ncbi:hypothetical protein GCM10027449_33540 [Sinomonas notoginsengisoli]|uniref:hypothetical protein n=1 Tax=Sinomonas notoginsengisoli TaxID=1457311 RepID=UPI001F3C8E83|nr:hypothetical protein [Sinomonas notoginsengisoli]
MNDPSDTHRPDPAADDDAWRDLVARLGGGPVDGDGSGPAPRELSAAERASGAGPGRGRGPRHGPARPDPADSARGGDHEDDAAGFSQFDPLGLAGQRPEARARGPVGEESDSLPGDFVPEEPEPVLAGADPVTVLAWCGALGGPVALLVFALVWRTVPGYIIVLLVSAFIAGVGTLIMRLPHNKDDDGDDGARV